MPEFRVSRLRVSRAIDHNQALAELWNTIPPEDLCSFWPKVDPDGNGSIRVMNVKPLPDEFGLRLGEMLYQLRSALDACIYQATAYGSEPITPQNESSLEFPITNDPKEFLKLVKRRLWGLPLDLIIGIESVQPYNTPTIYPAEKLVAKNSRCLGILHDLARIDRHRKLHMVGSAPLQFEPIFTLPAGVSVKDVRITADKLLTEQSEIATYKLIGFKTGMNIHVNPNMTTNIGCTEPPEPCHPNDTFAERLTEIINTVHSIVSIFEAYSF
jgi:hypothetical protein